MTIQELVLGKQDSGYVFRFASVEVTTVLGEVHPKLFLKTSSALVDLELSNKIFWRDASVASLKVR